MEVVDVDAVDLGAEADGVGGAVDGAPLDPRAGQPEVKPCGLWSRPLPLSDIGIRPNSPPQMTSVSSSSPRRFRSVSSPATGWSVRAHIAAWFASTSSWASQPFDVARVELDEPDARARPAGGPAGSACRTRRSGGRRGRRAACVSLDSPARSTASGAAALHAVGQLVGLDPRGELGVVARALAGAGR